MGSNNKTALITGAAKRIGAKLTEALHQSGYDVAIHYRSAATEAQELADRLNQKRPNSAKAFSADLNNLEQLNQLAEDILGHFGQLSLLINNASTFYPTPIEETSLHQWDELINSNLRAPYFLCATLSKTLRESNGCIINMIDIHAQRGLPGYPIYSIAKAGLEMLTKSLAKELAPQVRVNGISPGAILWPEQEVSSTEKAKILDKILLGRLGAEEDLAQAAIYLSQAEYITGQILAVDGGKSLFSH